MFTFANFSRCFGTLCLIGAGVLASVLPAFAEETEPAACDAAWHAMAEQRANQGLALEQGVGAENRVALWRLLVLGEEEPDRIGLMSDYHYTEGPFLPKSFTNDPEVTRILGLINAGNLDDAMAAIEALTRIPDPVNTDIATERLLVRSELLFAGVLWTTNWGWGESAGAVGTRAQKWMALLNAHFLSLPLSILNHDTVVNDAYWRASEDLRWFLRRDYARDWSYGQVVDDWWLPESARPSQRLAGVAEATRESQLLDWLQSMEGTVGLNDQPWIAYLSLRLGDKAYYNAYDRVVAMRDTVGTLPWRIAMVRRWAPIFERNGAHSGLIYWQQKDFLKKLEEREKICALTAAEQYALGPLRFHEARFRALNPQNPESGLLAWRGDINPGEAATANDRTRREIARFALATGQPVIARYFQQARDPKASEVFYETPALQALIASDLAGFAAANPDPSALNLLPVRVLAEFIEIPGLRADLRAAVARMTWVRAYVLNDTAILKRITPLVAETNAAMKPLLDVYQAAWTESGQRQAALALLLQTPGMQLVLPDEEDLFGGVSRVRIWSDKPEDWQEALFKSDHRNPNDGNWWCRFDLDRQVSKMKANFYDRPLGLSRVAYWNLSLPMQASLAEYRDGVLREHAILKQVDYEELGRLAKVPSAPVYLAQAATEWAQSSWWWDRYFQGGEMAETLQLSIQTTRWGCHRDGSNGAVSNAAWRALHDLFPDSEAAKNTPYWYN
jgi:hypothetical protein